MKKKSLRERLQDEMRYRNYSPRTLHSYTSILLQLAFYYKTSPDQLSSDQVKEYAIYLKDKKQSSVSTINQLISAWKFSEASSNDVLSISDSPL